MNRLRCLLFAATVVFSSSTLALGGDIHTPGYNAPPPPPPESALTTEPTMAGVTTPIPTEEIQIEFQDATKMLLELLLTIY
jgi:hypothetical protein